jgi:hypothetical protein
MTAESKAESNMRAAREVEARKRAERRDHALSQKLSLVQLSARRYGVIRLDSLAGVFNSSLYGGEEGSFHSQISSTLVFGPATFEKCREYIVHNAAPLPKEIAPQY